MLKTLVLLAASLVPSLAVAGIPPVTASREGDVVVLNTHNANYKHVLIDSEPSCEWEYDGKTSYRGETTASELHFFGVICRNNQCLPYDYDLIVKAEKWDTRPWGFILVIAVAFFTLGAILGVIFILNRAW